MWKEISLFLNEDDGAVSIDWVVLTAALAGFGVALLVNLGGTANDHGGRIETKMVSVGITTY